MKITNLLFLTMLIAFGAMSCQPNSTADTKEKAVTEQVPELSAEAKADKVKAAAINKKREDAMKEAPTAAQIATGDEICKCLNDIPLFSKVVVAKDKADFDKIAGDDAGESVKALQDCYNKRMPKAIKDLGPDAGIFALKSRKYLEKECMNSNSELWFHIGNYIRKPVKVQ